MKKTFCLYIPLVIIYLLTGCNNSNRNQRGGKITLVDSTGVSISGNTVKPVINVYIENSGSMDGYVNGNTEFKETVYNYLSDIIISGVSDSMNLFYINSKIIHFEPDIKNFIQKLNPATFKARGGNRGFSDIADVIDTVLNETQKNEIAILVTDGIFSPGKGINAAGYLVNQQIGIKRQISDYLKKFPTAAVIVYQLSSNFNGIYYNKVDNKISINEQRPFYIYVIGTVDQIVNLRNKVPDSKFKDNGIQNVFISVPGNQTVKYALNPNIGKYRKTRIPNTIENLKRDRGGKICFAVNVNFSNLLLDNAYLTNLENYESSSKYYSMEIKPNAKFGYTHTLYFTSSDNKIHKGIISVKLKSQFPDWIEKVNDNDGSMAVKGKTYGIKYQLSGIFDAYTFVNNYYTEIKINVN